MTIEKRTKILLVVLCLVILGLVAWLVWRAQPFAGQETEEAGSSQDHIEVPETLSEVSFNITPPFLDEGESGFLVLKANAEIQAVEVVFSYDENALELSFEAAGDFDNWVVASAQGGELHVTALQSPDSELTSAENGVVIGRVTVTKWIEDEVTFTLEPETCNVVTNLGSLACGDSTILLSKPTANGSDTELVVPERPEEI